MPDSEWYADGLRFACTQCGHCCSGPPGFVWFTDQEAQAMARYLGVSEMDLRGRFARTINDRWSLGERPAPDGAYDCVFLRRGQDDRAVCAIYPVRPAQCRAWPFWPENLASPATWEKAAQRCPGMSNGQARQGPLYTLMRIRVVRDSNVQTK